MTEIDETQLRHELEAAMSSHRELTAHLRSLEPVDAVQPSLLPGWTLAHVLTHIARVADGHLSMLSGQPQYPHGLEGRNADIEAGSVRQWSVLVDDVERTSDQLDQAWSAFTDWGGTATMIAGSRPVAMLPFLRQREVEIHRCDLGLGYGFADLPGDYVRRELRVMDMLWKARKPMGMTPIPDAALASPPHVRLAWLLGRHTIDGLEPAGIF